MHKKQWTTWLQHYRSPSNIPAAELSNTIQLYPCYSTTPNPAISMLHHYPLASTIHPSFLSSTIHYPEISSIQYYLPYRAIHYPALSTLLSYPLSSNTHAAEIHANILHGTIYRERTLLNLVMYPTTEGRQM